MKRRAALRAVPAGVLVTLALPPFGWWPLAIVGVALLAGMLERSSIEHRWPVAAGFAIGFVAPGLFWMSEFSLPGWVLAMLIEAVIVTAAISIVPPGRFQIVGLPAAFVLADAFRGRWPFSGVPIATFGETQTGGPIMQAARVGGTLLIAALVALAGLTLLSVVRLRARRALVGLVLVAAVVLAATHAADGSRASTFRAAMVQGGGKRGTRAISSSAACVFDAHVAATAKVPDGVDLILWPEDVVDVDDDILTTPQGDKLSSLAAMHAATLVAGVVSGKKTYFLNVARAWGPDGSPGPVYEKNHRVPFGEYIPFRALVSKVADVSAVPVDAHIGHGPGILPTRAGRLGVVISYEVFFARRARAAMKAGASVLLVPTNASSYSSTQMPALELGDARLRAIETGRQVLQAAPTGFTAVVDERGRVHQRTDLGRQQVLTATVERRHGATPYTTLGDGPFVLGALAALALSWLLTRRAGR